MVSGHGIVKEREVTPRWNLVRCVLVLHLPDDTSLSHFMLSSHSWLDRVNYAKVTHSFSAAGEYFEAKVVIGVGYR